VEPFSGADLHFEDGSLLLMNIALGIIMFGIALELRPSDFGHILRSPKAVILGFISQFLYLPAITILLILFLRLFIDIPPGLALGMVLVSACPGGNVSNFISVLAGANIALSISLTAVATLSAIAMTPFSFAFWGSMLPDTKELLLELHVNMWEMVKTVLILLGLPLMVGMLVRRFQEKIADRLAAVIKVLGIVIFVLFIVIAFYSNMDAFFRYIKRIFGIVFLHNFLALAGGYLIGLTFGLPEKSRRTLSIETGIQNSGLGLVLIFSFFQESAAFGAMAVVAAWWGIWHIVAGLSIAFYWGRRKITEH